MKLFVVLASVFAAASAGLAGLGGAGGNGGYAAGGSGGSGGYGAPALGGGGGGGGYGAPAQGGFGGSSAGGFAGSSFGGSGGGAGSFGAGAGGFGGGAGAGGFGGGGGGGQVRRFVSIHVAPDEPVNTQARVIRVPGGQDKHVNIIFVKAPSASSQQQTEVILPEQNEQKTLVYVLVKKAENTADVKIRAPSPTKPSKPEVFFIRYKNQDGGAGAGGGGFGGGQGGGFGGGQGGGSGYGAPAAPGPAFGSPSQSAGGYA